MFELNNYVQIKIINKDKDGVNCHYNDYDGQKGIIREIDTNWGLRYILYYEDNDFRTIDNKNGGIFIHEEDLIKLSDSNESLLLKMNKQFEKEEYERKYRWGKCDKCGAPLDMHYKLWCPTCISKEHLVKDKIIDILTCLTWCEVRVEGIKDRVWDYLCDNWNFSNDTIKRFQVEDWLDVENDDLKFIANEFSGLGIEYVEFSW